MLVFFIAIILTIISLITLSNVLLFPRLKTCVIPYDTPFVSVMIPARNEATVIAKTIAYLMKQDYPNYEVILLDDNSTDNTGEIAKQAGQADKLTVIQGKPLPEGWIGKNWACHQMQQVAKGDIFIFTDADVIWEENGLSALIADMQRTQADLFTVWSTQQTITWAERLIVPTMAMVVVGYLPVIGAHYIPLTAFGAANGQCMAWRKSAYKHVGGHEAVKDNVLEDVTLARKVKACGLRLRMADGNRLVRCRMYDGWASVRNGYAKNILAGYGSVSALIIATIFHWLIFLVPWVFILFQETRLAGLLLVIMGLAIRAITAAFTHQRVVDTLLMPITVLLLTRIALQAIYWHYRYGGPKWKGRTIRKAAHHG
ncbi:MAG: glycosyltransferase family 2 protein [Phototrophicales bacterium]